MSKIKKLFTLLLTAACFTASAQIEVEYPYNPDNQNDGHVGIEDILEILTVYGEEFTPEQLIVEGTSLTEWIQLLSETVIQQQAQIDSLESSLQEPILQDSLFGLEDVFQEIIDSLVITTIMSPFSFQFERIAFDNAQWLPLEGTSLVFTEYTFETEGFLVYGQDGWQANSAFIMPSDFNLEIATTHADSIYNNFQSTFSFNSTHCLPIRSGERLILTRNPTQPVVPFLDWFGLNSLNLEESLNEQSIDDLGPCQGEFTVNYHGYDYELVEIGDQCWFAEDLVSQSFSDDSPITFVEEEEYDATDPSGPVFAHCEIEGNGSFGLLYNWLAISDDRGLCPSGWHTSTKQEWESLVSFIETNFLVTTQGALKSKTGWVNAGANHLGFNAKPSGYYGGGYCYSGWAPNNLGLWTTSEIDANGDIGTYRFSSNSPLQYTADCSQGFCVAVRCVKD